VLPVTCDSGGGCVRGGRLRAGLRPGPGSGGACLGVGGAQLGLGEALHHVAVLRVALPAAAFLLPAVLGHHKVVAAVVAEDAPAQPAQNTYSPPPQGAPQRHTVFVGAGTGSVSCPRVLWCFVCTVRQSEIPSPIRFRLDDR